jgi:uncharacterized protein (DUF1697 family)
VATHAAFLRAVNLGTTRKASGEALRSCFEGAGFDDVATFRNSGNVLFTASKAGGKAKLTAAVEKALAADLGFDVTVFIRTASQVRAIAEQRPFPPQAVTDSKGKLQVALLGSKPKATARKKVLGLASDEDLLAVEGTELYWLPSGGTQKSGLDMKAIDRALGLNTIRTMGTIEAMAGKFF